MSFRFVHRQKDLLCTNVDDIKLAGKKQNIDPMWKVLNKEVDLGRTKTYGSLRFSGKSDVESGTCCSHVLKLQMETQRQCEISKDICGQLQNHVFP